MTARVIVSGPLVAGRSRVSLTTVGAGLLCTTGCGQVSAGRALAAAAAMASRTQAEAASAQTPRFRRVRWDGAMTVLRVVFGARAGRRAGRGGPSRWAVDTRLTRG